MSLILPIGMPAVEILRAEGFEVYERDCSSAAISPSVSEKHVRVLFLNIMPEKQRTEMDFFRALGDVPGVCVEMLPMRIAGQTYKTTPQEYVEAFYQPFEVFEPKAFDGCIITGAPLEDIPFESVRYWEQLCLIMQWCRSCVRSTLFICWAAQAAAYHHYGIQKYPLSEKMFGIFTQSVQSASPIVEGLSPQFRMPVSRHTEVRAAEFPSNKNLKIVAEGCESGVGVATDSANREVYSFGHMEYAADTLHREFCRDRAKGLPIAPPHHYYAEPEQQGGEAIVDFSWRDDALRFYANWVRHYVCASS